MKKLFIILMFFMLISSVFGNNISEDIKEINNQIIILNDKVENISGLNNQFKEKVEMLEFEKTKLDFARENIDMGLMILSIISIFVLGVTIQRARVGEREIRRIQKLANLKANEIKQKYKDEKVELNSLIERIESNTNYAIYFTKGLMGNKLNNLNDSNEDLFNALKFIRNENDKAECHFYLGRNYADLGDYKNSIKYFKKVLEYNPNNVNSLYNLILSLLNIGDYEEVIEYCDKLLILNQLLDEVFNLKGLALMNLNNLDDAKICFEHSIEKNQELFAPHFNLYLVYKSFNSYNKALKELKICIELEPERIDLKERLKELKTLINKKKHK